MQARQRTGRTGLYSGGWITNPAPFHRAPARMYTHTHSFCRTLSFLTVLLEMQLIVTD